MQKHFTSFLFLICSVLSSSFAQIDGDNIFEEDQIITIDLTFSQEGFWDSLVLNYETSTYMMADLELSDLTGTYTFENVGVRLKGNSSYNHPGDKKSFKIDFNEYVSGQNYDGLKKLNFSNAFKDPSLLREKLFFDMCQTVGVAAPRANFANVYFNGELWGFYTVVEQIDDQFLDWRILDDDGNLFKAGDNFGVGPGGGGDEADLRYYGTDQSAYEDLYELKSNEEENDWTDLIQFTDFINNSTASEFENDLADWLELEEYLRSAALDNLFSNLDSYTNSARNYYIYHNLTTDKWEWIKWDGNESFGSYGGQGVGNMTTLAIDYHSANRPLLENIFNSEVLYNQYKEEMCYLIENYFNSDYMNPKIDVLYDLIQSSVYADGNKMYSNTNFDDNIDNDISSGSGPMGGTFYGLKSFIQQRNNYISGVLDCSIILNVNSIDETPITVFPNPFSTEVFLDWEGNTFEALVVYNTLGQEVYKVSVEGLSNASIDLSFLQTGVYYARLESPGDLSITKTIIPLIKL